MLKRQQLYRIIPGIFMLLLLLSTYACDKESYFIDSGKHNPNFNGTVLQYLETKPLNFDTLVQVIRLAGMEETLSNDSITFFAPGDPSFERSINALNAYLMNNGRDTISDLADIKPAVWKKLLSMYIFEGTNQLKDYRQVDTAALDTYGGQNYLAYNEMPMNVGVIYHDAVKIVDPNDPTKNVVIKYAGYRQLLLSYLSDLSQPQQRWLSVIVASSDIAPTNGIIHALRFDRHFFGFDPDLFVLAATESGIDN